MKKAATAAALALALVTACSADDQPTESDQEQQQEQTSSAAPTVTAAPPEAKVVADPASFSVDVLPGIVQPGPEPAAANGASSILWLAPEDGKDGEGGNGGSGKPSYLVTRLTDGEPTDDTREIPGRPTAWTTLEPGNYRITRTDLDQPEATDVRVDSTGWRSVLDDEFTDGLGPAWSVRQSAEQETCTTKLEGALSHSRNRDEFRADLIRVTDGVAILGVTDRSRSTVCPDGRLLRASGHIGTQGTVELDTERHVIAARIKMPEAAGPHTGFWMRGIGPPSKTSTPDVPDYQDQAEMDIVESFGRRGTANCRPDPPTDYTETDWRKSPRMQSNFYYNWNPTAGYLHCVPGSQWRHIPGHDGKGYGPWDDYHVYAVDWVPGRYYRVWWDGVLIRTYQGPELSSGRTSFLVLSALMNDGPPEYDGPEDQKYIKVDREEYVPGDAFLTPDDLSAMKVDWVRVWAEK